MPSWLRSRVAPAAAMALVALAAVAAGCGGDSSDEGDSGSESHAAPSASLFPPADGKTLEELLAETDGPADIVVSPAGKVLNVGKNRVAFGVFNVDRSQITDAEIAIYAAPAKGGAATGPYPARIESLATEPAFRAKSTADDPDTALAAYVTEVDFAKAGNWEMIAMIREGSGIRAVRVPLAAPIGSFDSVPAVGEKAPSVQTDTADQVGDLSQIDTRVPPSSMHDEDLADVLGKKPVVLLFATPSLCQSRTCGPVVDVAAQVKQQFGEDAAFIHQEVYVDNEIDKGIRPPLKAFELPSEPFLFVIDREGVVRTTFEGPFSVAELTEAVEGVSK